MNKGYHEMIVEIAVANMPADYQRRLAAGFPLELFLEYAHVEYASDRLNELPHEHVDHCYKLIQQGRNLVHVGEGDPIGELAAIGRGMVDLALAGEDELVRINIAKGTHYLIDVTTFPHCVEKLWDKYHVRFEDYSEAWLASNRSLVEKLTAGFKPEIYRNYLQMARGYAQEAYYLAQEQLPFYKIYRLPHDRMLANMAAKHVEMVMRWLVSFERCL